MIKPPETTGGESAAQSLHKIKIVVYWFEELKDRVPRDSKWSLPDRKLGLQRFTNPGTQSGKVTHSGKDFTSCSNLGHI
jgi:hypothetical protein